MTQFSFPVIDPAVHNGSQLSDWLNQVWPSVWSQHAGVTRPSYALAGLLWSDTAVAGQVTVKMFDGSQDIVIGTVSGGAFTISPLGVDLIVAKAAPAILLNKPVSGTACSLIAATGGASRWEVSVADGATELGGNSGSNFSLNRYNDAGAYVDTPFAILRADGLLRTTSGLAVERASPFVRLNKPASGTECTVYGSTNNATRWAVSLGGSSAESGGNAGSDFHIHRYSDAGAYLGSPLTLFRATGNLLVTGTASKPGGGMWLDSSDLRIKTDIHEFHAGLEIIRQLNPVRFRWHPDTERDSETLQIGLVAQQVEDVMPWAVQAEPTKIGKIEHDDMRVLDATSIVYLLINAVQTLADRVEALEAAAGIGPSPTPSISQP